METTPKQDNDIEAAINKIKEIFAAREGATKGDKPLESIIEVADISLPSFKLIEAGSQRETAEYSPQLTEILKLHDTRIVPADTMHNISLGDEPTYAKHVQDRYGKDAFKGLLGTTFISPKSFSLSPDSTDPLTWGKDYTSGRSFHIKIGTDTLIVKGGDLLRGDTFRNNKDSAPPMIGAATLEELKQEYTAAYLLQEIALKAGHGPLQCPMPIQLSELTHYMLPGGTVVPYDAEFLMLLHNHNEEILGDVVSSLAKFKVDPLSAPGETSSEAFTWLFNKFLETVGHHGSYIYAIAGNNKRLADYHTDKDVESLRNLYPEASSDKDIVSLFTQRVASLYGTMHGAGLVNTNASNCWLLDTGVDGTTFDIGNLTHSTNQEALLSTMISLIKLVQYFQNIFRTEPEVLDEASYEELWTVYISSYKDAMSIIKDAGLKAQLTANLKSLIKQRDNLRNRHFKPTDTMGFRVDRVRTYR